MIAQPGAVHYAVLDPGRGSEQKGNRPVVVISAAPMGPRAIVVPTTTKRRDWPTRVPVEFYGIPGEAMCDQVR